jgi:hypothetical protein
VWIPSLSASNVMPPKPQGPAAMHGSVSKKLIPTNPSLVVCCVDVVLQSNVLPITRRVGLSEPARTLPTVETCSPFHPSSQGCRRVPPVCCPPVECAPRHPSSRAFGTRQDAPYSRKMLPFSPVESGLPATRPCVEVPAPSPCVNVSRSYANRMRIVCGVDMPVDVSP